MMEERYLTVYRRLAFFAAAACIVLLAIAGLQEEMLQEWQGYQRAYREFRLRRAGSPADSRHGKEPVTIAEISLPIAGRVDRCISCHQGIEDTLCRGAAHPLGFHGGDLLVTHDTRKFGCTLCHGGNGRMLAVQEICGRDSSLQDPATSLEFVQAWCAQCHGALFEETSPVTGAERLFLGRTTVRESGCLGCHRISGTGGVLGPDLSRQGMKSRHQYDHAHVEGPPTAVGWLRSHFRKPDRVTPGSVMPAFDLAPPRMDALVTYVLGLKTVDLPLEYLAVERMMELRSRRTLDAGDDVYGLFCVGCHGREGRGRSHNRSPFGVPALANTDFQAVASEEFLAFTVRHGRSGRRMGSWSEEVSGVRARERAALVNRIRQWRPAGPGVQEVLGAPGRVEAGRDLFERECRQCHTGDGQPGAAPSIEHPQVLSLAGDRFLLETIMYGRSNTAMPAWSHLTAAEFASLIRFLRSRSPSRPSVEKGAEPRGDPERGARLFSSCTRCHGKEGRGGIGPAILNPDFLRSVTPEFLQSTIRSGRSHTAMFGWEGALAGSASAPDGGVEDVVAYLLSRRDEVTDRVHPGESVGRPAQGKEFYASRCSECHGGAGEGIAAPALNNQEFLNAGSNGFLLATITLGRRGTGMPSWGRGDSLHHSLTLQERQDLVAFIRLWQRRVIRTADGIQARAAVPER